MCHNLFQNSFYALSDFLNFKTICRLQEHMDKKKMQKLDNKKKREKKLEDNLKEIITAVRSLLFKSCT